MPKRKSILNAALKALLAGLKTSAWVKIPATFISEIASLPKDKRESLDTASAEKFDELLTQTGLSTTNAALAAVGTEQIKVLVANLTQLSQEKLEALATLTQEEYKEILNELHTILDNTEKIKSDNENHDRQTQEKLNEILKRLDPGIPKEIRLAVENIFMDILKEEDIPQWQWPEKLQAITQRHQDLLEKWQSVQSGDPAVDKLRNQARRTIQLGNYHKADKELQDAIEIDRKAIQSQQERLDNRKLSMSQSLAARADIAETKLDYKKAIDLYKQALDILPQNQQTVECVYMNNLGSLYHTVADYKEADPLMQRALKIDEASLGKDHPNVAIRLNNLAQLYQATNRLKEAEPLMERHLVIFLQFTRRTGHPHPHLQDAINNYSALLMEMGHSQAQVAARLNRLAPEMFESPANQVKEQ